MAQNRWAEINLTLLGELIEKDDKTRKTVDQFKKQLQ